MDDRLKSCEHIRICYAKDTVCHWPRFGGIWSWPSPPVGGHEEILLGHIHSHSEYKDPQDKAHGEHGIWRRATTGLQRSLDGGRTWGEPFDLFDHRQHLEDQWAWLGLNPVTRKPLRKNTEVEHPPIDMASSNSVLFLGKAWAGLPRVRDGKVSHDRVLWGLRSSDRGRSWEKHPSLLFPHFTDTADIYANSSLVLPDGRVLAYMTTFLEGRFTYKSVPQLYLSTDQGVSWHFVSNIYYDMETYEQCLYPSMLLLPSGRLFCSLGMWIEPASVRWTAVTYSDDLGNTWAPPRRIDRWSVSPFPVLLRDGRIVIVSVVRCQPPMRMCCIVSEDEGKTWSQEILLRDDSPPVSDQDGGYPVATELQDGRIFTAYYWQVEERDLPWPGGRKHIAGTFFELK
jgi:hypothetical protein